MAYHHQWGIALCFAKRQGFRRQHRKFNKLSRLPMFEFEFEDVLFRFQLNAPAFELLFAFVPNRATCQP